MDDKPNLKSARSGDADPSVDRTTGDPVGRQALRHDEPDAPRLLDLSWPQVIGGALAAMTAAVLGSRLGVAGTVLGAALASVCAAVFGSVYTTSIRRTQRMARAALKIAQSQRPRGRAVPQVTTLVETDGLITSTDTGSPAADRETPMTSRPEAGEPRRSRRVLVTSIVGAAAVFVVAIGAIAGFELLSGRTLDGNKGTTTVSEVFRGSGGHKSDGTDSKKHGPDKKPTSGTSSGPSTGPSSESDSSAAPGDQSSGGAESPAPEASGPAGSGSDPSAGQNSGGQDSGTSGGGSGSSGSDSSGSGSSGSGSSGSDSSGSDSSGSGSSGSDSSGSGSAGNTRSGAVGSGSSDSGPADSGVSGS